MPILAAAADLGVPPGTLRRWVREGAPVVARGRRGRGQALLVDPDAVRRWLEGQRDGGAEAVAWNLAGRLGESIGAAMAEAHRIAPDKRDGAWIAVAGWQLAVGAVLDLLREHVQDIPDPQVPEPIERLRKIARR